MPTFRETVRRFLRPLILISNETLFFPSGTSAELERCCPDAGGTVRRLHHTGDTRHPGTGPGGGVCLFALNYGIFLLKIRMGDAFNSALAFLLVSALIAGSIYLLRKKA